MYVHPFRASGARSHWLQFWVLLLLVPACFALATMPVTMAAVAITLTFGLPLTTSLATHVHCARDLRAAVPGAIRFALGVSLTLLGLVGLVIFSPELALAAAAAYVVTVGLLNAWGDAHAAASFAAVPETPPTSSDDPETPTSVVVTLDKVRTMTDAELCHTWRRSFVALQRARGVDLRALLVETRQLLLDEVEARHPAGLRAWLSSGARAAGGPDRFIGPADSEGGHPEAA